MSPPPGYFPPGAMAPMRPSMGMRNRLIMGRPMTSGEPTPFAPEE